MKNNCTRDVKWSLFTPIWSKYAHRCGALNCHSLGYPIISKLPIYWLISFMWRMGAESKGMSDEWNRCCGPPKNKTIATTPNRLKRVSKLHRRALSFTIRRIQCFYLVLVAIIINLYFNFRIYSIWICGCCTQPEITCDCNRTPVLGQVFCCIYLPMEWFPTIFCWSTVHPHTDTHTNYFLFIFVVYVVAHGHRWAKMRPTQSRSHYSHTIAALSIQFGPRKPIEIH